MTDHTLSREEAKEIAKRAGCKLTRWDVASKSFKVEGTHSQLSSFRCAVAQLLEGLYYLVTDDGSYPYWATRLYQPTVKERGL